ncbi:MAG: hypothetical protein AAF849_20380 [Bacteroidota bacterium]
MGKRTKKVVGAKANRWKRWWSYFSEYHVESAASAINPHLYVSLRNGRYQLCSANAVYSYEDLYTNFARAFQQIDLPPDGASVLLLGFGLGSIPQILEQKLRKKYQYIAVELDESVLYLAQKYTLPQLKSPIETICADAYAYVLQSQEAFDLICMDVFLDASIPNRFQSTLFLDHLKALLVSDATLLYNCLSVTAEDRAAARFFFEEAFKIVFPAATYLDVGGNWILVGKCKDSNFSRVE